MILVILSHYPPSNLRGNYQPCELWQWLDQPVKQHACAHISPFMFDKQNTYTLVYSVSLISTAINQYQTSIIKYPLWWAKLEMQNKTTCFLCNFWKASTVLFLVICDFLVVYPKGGTHEKRHGRNQQSPSIITNRHQLSKLIITVHNTQQSITVLNLQSPSLTSILTIITHQHLNPMKLHGLKPSNRPPRRPHLPAQCRSAVVLHEIDATGAWGIWGLLAAKFHNPRTSSRGPVL